MLKKNTRKRLLAGALATVMMLTMCPSWALADNLADDEGIATLPANEEIAVPVVDSTPAADTTETPAVPTPSVPEAKPAEGQDTAPAPSNGGANGGTDSTESGNSTNSTIPEGSGNISQKNDVVSNSPANTTSLQEPLIDPAWLWPPKKENIKYFVLLPKRGRPQNGASQGPDNYLPSSLSDGGVEGCNNVTGYTGGDLTQDGKDKADEHRTGDELTNGYTKIDDVGVESEYLVLPKDLGFFDEDHWEDNGTYTGHGDPATILGTDFNGKDIEIVWYTIKHLADGYHIDGYVKNVAINVTYHSNFGKDEIFTDPTRTGTYYKARSYADTSLSARENYKFVGWYTDMDCTEAYEPATLMTSLDLYAKWEPTEYNVIYKVDGVETKSTKHAFNTSVKIEAEPTKEGYTFSGWKIDNADAENFTMPAHDVVIEGTFTAREYNVTYKVDGVETKSTKHAFNTSVKIDDVPTKEGHTFSGWKIDNADAENFTMPAHDVVIEGTFTAREYNVIYKVDTEVVGTDVYDFNSDVVIRDVPTKEGYTFSGWKIGTADAENFKMPAHDVTIEGTFAKNSSGHHHRKPTVTIPDKVPTGLNGNDHYAYIVGYPDKTVRPQNGITRAEVATIFFRLLTDETRNANSAKSNSYSDVAAGAWYNHAVSTLSAMGIVKGDSDGKFNPNAPITRAEFAAIAARFDDKANSTTADFSDIVSHWAKNEISAASNNGWINGYPDGTFRPDNKITRAEAMTLVNRVLKRLPETAEDLHDDMIKWSDNSDASQWFYLAVQEATNSHYYKAKENKSEKWTELRDTRDWTELEK